MSYWQVTIQFERENDRGRIQKTREVYLVDAMSGTETEAKTNIILNIFIILDNFFCIIWIFII